MKITFILPGSNRSGGIKVAAEAANGLLQKGHKVRLLVCRFRGDLRLQLLSLWLKTRYAHTYSWLDFFNGTVEKFDDIKRCAFEDNEVVVAVGWWSAKEVSRLRHPGIQKVHYVHSVLRSRDAMKEAWAENVPKIVVASFLKEIIEKTCGQKVVAVVPNGIDTNKYYRSVPGNQRNGIGTIFGKSYHKDPETVLGVLKELQHLCPNTPQRIVSTRRKPKEIARRAYYRLPSLEKIREIYSRSLVWIVASRSEGFGIPILEAMACGCAVVATDCGGPQDIIIDGENGLLVDVGNVKQIVEKVKLLLDDSELRKQLVQNSRNTLCRFSMAKSVDKLEKVLSNLQSQQQA